MLVYTCHIYLLITDECAIITAKDAFNERIMPVKDNNEK